jgi:hypothetical protein
MNAIHPLDSDLGTADILHDGHIFSLFFGTFTDALKAFQMAFMGAVRKIQPENVDACLNQFIDRRDIVTDGA